MIFLFARILFFLRFYSLSSFFFCLRLSTCIQRSSPSVHYNTRIVQYIHTIITDFSLFWRGIASFTRRTSLIPPRSTVLPTSTSTSFCTTRLLDLARTTPFAALPKTASKNSTVGLPNYSRRSGTYRNRSFPFSPSLNTHSLHPHTFPQQAFGKPFRSTAVSDNAAETMLTRSPVPARSPSASPSSFHTSFHYVPSSPPKRSPKPPTAVSRRPSTSSPLGMNKSSSSSVPSTSTLSTAQQPQAHPPTTAAASSTAPPPPKPRGRSQGSALPAEQPYNYVGVDAATQYSPMEPYDYFVPRDVQAKPSLSSASNPLLSRTAAQRPSTDHAATAGTTAILPDASQAARNSTQSPPPVEQPPMLKAPHPLLSPNKRRNSEGPGAVIEEASGSAQVAQSLPKRAKPDVIPPKVLPVRYELCAIEDVVVLIANMLSELIETNDALAMRSGHLTRFHSR